MRGMKCPWALTECTDECAIFILERGKCSVRVVSEMIGGVGEDASEIESAEEGSGDGNGSEEVGEDDTGEGTSGGDVENADGSAGEVRGHSRKRASKKGVDEADA